MTRSKYFRFKNTKLCSLVTKTHSFERGFDLQMKIFIVGCSSDFQTPLSFSTCASGKAFVSRLARGRLR